MLCTGCHQTNLGGVNRVLNTGWKILTLPWLSELACGIPFELSDLPISLTEYNGTSWYLYGDLCLRMCLHLFIVPDPDIKRGQDARWMGQCHL